MKELIFGTTNEAKIKQIRSALAPAGINVQGISKDLLVEVIEDGETAIENARKKALSYAKILNCVVFSMDNGLYFNNLPADKQPGLKVRRIPATTARPTDEELIKYYSTLIAEIGTQINGYWEYGLCVATPQGEIRETTVISPRIFVSTPSSNREPGYPLESLQIEPLTGKRIVDMSQDEKDAFWQKEIGEPLLGFILSIPFE